MTRNEVLQIRVEPALRERLARLRAERHVNISAWLRALISEALDRELGHPAASAPQAGPEAPVRWKPAKLPGGGWGSALRGPPADALPAELAGRQIVVTDRAGRSWTAEVAEIVRREPGLALVRDTGRPATPQQEPRA